MTELLRPKIALFHVLLPRAQMLERIRLRALCRLLACPEELKKCSFSSGKDFVVYCFGSNTTTGIIVTIVAFAAVAVGGAAAAGATVAAATAAAAIAAIVKGTESAAVVRFCCCCCCWVRRRAVNFPNSIILARTVVSASWPAVACVQLDLVGEVVVQISLRFLGYCVFGNGLES